MQSASLAASQNVKIVGVGSGLCLSYPYGNTQGRQLVQKVCADHAGQIFNFSKNPDGSYSFSNPNSGLCLEVLGQSQNAGAVVDEWSCNGGSNQKWIANSVSPGIYTLQPESGNSSLCLDVYQASSAIGALIDQYTCKSQSNQYFQVLYTANGQDALGGSGVPPATQMSGVNLSGGEFALFNPNARLNYDYVYPNSTELDYYAGKGMKVIRLPFDISRVMNATSLAPNGTLNMNELASIDSVVMYANSKGLTVILDPHNYGQMYDYSAQTSRYIGIDPLMPSSNFAAFWGLMAQHYKKPLAPNLAVPNVYFGLMNEPNQQSAQLWHDIAVAAVAAIRANGASQKILIPGTAWTGAHSWLSVNASVWQAQPISDPNFAFEVHQYLDSDFSGTHSACQAGAGSNPNTIADFINWARQYHLQAFLGESGWSQDPSCPPEATALMTTVAQSSDVIIGYSYWAGGPWEGSYMYTIEPQGLGSNNVIDMPQMTLLQKIFGF